MKDIIVQVPFMFSTGAVNHMLNLARENDLGSALKVVWRSDWNWYIEFHNGRVIVTESALSSFGVNNETNG